MSDTECSGLLVSHPLSTATPSSVHWLPSPSPHCTVSTPSPTLLWLVSHQAYSSRYHLLAFVITSIIVAIIIAIIIAVMGLMPMICVIRAFLRSPVNVTGCASTLPANISLSVATMALSKLFVCFRSESVVVLLH